jgi:cation-transporting P-type ATPase 13A2
VHRYIRYYKAEDQFHPVAFDYVASSKALHSHKASGLDTASVSDRKAVFGACSIDVAVPSVLLLLLDGIFHPFFVFQIFSCLLWFYEEYTAYAITILVMSIVSLIVNLLQTRANIKAVRRLAHYECRVKVLRGQWAELRSTELVPGDVVEVAEGSPLPCDLVLLAGLVLADESMLTGESQLVVKEGLPSSASVFYHREKKFTLFAGTVPKICKDRCLAMVVATGFFTAKGDLVRSILFPKPNRFRFYEDSFRFVGIMAVIALAGMVWSVVFLMVYDSSTEDIVVHALDLVTIAIPPVLPLVLTIGTSFSIYRLQQLGVTCISLPAVNAAGRVSVVVFDKTGTITEDWMSLRCVFTEQELPSSAAPPALQENMACCNSLTYIHGEIQGDPMEIAVLKSTAFDVVESTARWTVAGAQGRSNVLQVYHFAAETKRMGVVVQGPFGLVLHMKGAPEVIMPLCEALPEGLQAAITQYTREGYRVLACGYKKLQQFDADLPLTDLETNLEFLGLLVLENPLKGDSANTIRTLLAANIRCVISTGDAHLTGISVAKKCNLIPSKVPMYVGELENGRLKWRDPTGKTGFLPKKCSVSITGEILEYMVRNKHPDMQQVVDKGVVFGRMFPQHKILLIELLQVADTMVAMVGDGANDCGALKMSDVGLSLSTAEASIAAPFSTADIKGILHVLKEGRAALMTSLESFKFVGMYSIIQFFAVCLLTTLGNKLQDVQFLYQDLAIILPISVSMAYAGPYHMLATVLPPGALFSLPIIRSLAGQICVQVVFQVLGILLMLPFSWHENSADDPEEDEDNADNTTVFIISCFQLLIVGIAFNIGPPYRRSTVENFWFTGSVAVIVLVTTYLLMVPEILGDLFGIVDLHREYKWIILALVAANLFCSYFYEKFFLPKIKDDS